MTTAVAGLDRVFKSFGHRDVLRGTTLALDPGITGLVGVNGAGKTTVMSLLATLDEPSSGQVHICGEKGPFRGRALVRVRSNTALMPQAFSFAAGLRVGDYLTYVGWLRGLDRKTRAARARDVLEMVDLADRFRDQMTSLSGGMVRRVNLAQALLGDSRLLLLDEPTVGLDPQQRIEVRSIIADIAARAGTAILVSSHLMEDVVALADRVCVLHDGRIVFDAGPDALRAKGEQLVTERSQLSPYEAAFLAITGPGHEA